MFGIKHAMAGAAAAGLCLAATAAAQASTAALASTAAQAASAAQATTIVPGLATLQTIACPTPGTCLAGGVDTSGGAVLAFINAATGTVKIRSGLKDTSQPGTIACPDKTTCLALVEKGTVQELARITVSSGAMKIIGKLPAPPKDETNPLYELACAGAKTCYAAGWQGNPRGGSGTTGLLIRLSVTGKVEKVTTGGGEYAGLTCESATTCLASTSTSKGVKIFPIVNAKPGRAYDGPRGSEVTRLACYGTKACYALGVKVRGTTVTSELWPVNPKTGKSGKVTILRGLGAIDVACYSSSRCVVVGSTGITLSAAAAVTVQSGKAGKLVTYSAPTEPFTAVACATAKACYAVGPDNTATATQAEVTKV